MKPLVLITAPVATRSGYGSHSRDIVHSLLDMNKFDVRVMSVRWGSTSMNALNKNNPNDKRIIDILMSDDALERQPDVHIHIVVPNEFQQIGKYNIGITAGIETTGCVSDWIQGCNRMDLIIVPSEFTKKVFLDTVFQSQNDRTGEKGPDLGIEKPIEVLFEGTDLNIYKKTNEFSEDLVKEFEQISERFNFLYTGHWLQGNLGEDRKDTGMLVKVFLETFKNVENPPGLIMKTSGATFSVIDREECLSKIRDIKSTVKGRLPNIYLFHGDFTDDEMNQLYNHPKVKAHVSLTHGEGFGRPLLEATLSEKPVIATNWSGHVDFLNSSYTKLLPGSLSNVPRGAFHEKMFLNGSQWFTVNYPNAGKVMMEMFKNQPKYLINAKKQSIVSKEFSFDNMTKKFEDILNNYLPTFEEQPQAVKLQLPKLKKVDSTTTTKKLDIKLPNLKKV
jgi:glycosyltransferase involved in cell wall biosynthesis